MSIVKLVQNTIVGNDGTFITYKMWTHEEGGVPYFLILQEPSCPSSVDNFALYLALSTKGSVLKIERLERTLQELTITKQLLKEMLKSVVEHEIIHALDQPVIITFESNIDDVKDFLDAYPKIDFSLIVIKQESEGDKKLLNNIVLQNDLSSTTIKTLSYVELDMAQESFFGYNLKSVTIFYLNAILSIVLAKDYKLLAKTISDTFNDKKSKTFLI